MALTEKGKAILFAGVVHCDAKGKVAIEHLVQATGLSRPQVIGALRGLYHKDNAVMAKCSEKGFVLVTEKGLLYDFPAETEDAVTMVGNVETPAE